MSTEKRCAARVFGKKTGMNRGRECVQDGLGKRVGQRCKRGIIVGRLDERRVKRTKAGGGRVERSEEYGRK